MTQGGGEVAARILTSQIILLCGNSRPVMKRRTVLAGVGALLASGCIQPQNQGSGGESSGGTPTSTQRGSPSARRSTSQQRLIEIKQGQQQTHRFEDGVKIKDFGWTNKELDYGTPGAKGVVKNTTQSRLAEASVSVDFYDDQTQIGTNVSWFNFLNPGEYGTLEVPYTGDEPGRVSRLIVSASAQATPPTPLNNGQVSLSGKTLSEDENGRPVLTGTVKNANSGRLGRIFIHVNFYRENELLGMGRDAIPRLAAGDSAEWQTTAGNVRFDDATRYETVVTVQD